MMMSIINETLGAVRERERESKSLEKIDFICSAKKVIEYSNRKDRFSTTRKALIAFLIVKNLSFL